MPYHNDNMNIPYNYITYNTNKEKNSSGLPSNKTLYEYTDDDIIKYAIPLIKDQSGCRFLQEKSATHNFGSAIFVYAYPIVYL